MYAAQLTGVEILSMFGRLRGISEAELPSVVNDMLVLLDLTKHSARLCGTYSGGNKRKLSTAIALIGNPPIVFLDEPTRFFSFLKNKRKKKQKKTYFVF